MESHGSLERGAAQRLEAYLQAGQDVVILHFGDHDPSGLDMTRDIEERLRLFLLHDWVRFERDNHSHLPLEERRAWLIREHQSSPAGTPRSTCAGWR